MIAGPFGKRRDRVRIDTSLAIVNIVLLLLFFFLIVGQTPQPAADMRLSETRDLPLNQLPRPILIVRAEDDWQLDGQPVSPELLPAAMAAPVLRHRMALSFAARARGDRIDDVIARLTADRARMAA